MLSRNTLATSIPAPCRRQLEGVPGCVGAVVPHDPGDDLLGLRAAAPHQQPPRRLGHQAGHQHQARQQEAGQGDGQLGGVLLSAVLI